MNESEGPSMVQGTDIVHKINSYQGRKTGKQKKDLVISLLPVFDTAPNSLTDIKSQYILSPICLYQMTKIYLIASCHVYG